MEKQEHGATKTLSTIAIGQYSNQGAIAMELLVNYQLHPCV